MSVEPNSLLLEDGSCKGRWLSVEEVVVGPENVKQCCVADVGSVVSVPEEVRDDVDSDMVDL
eukprot:747514-Heterocapsa_arctica.AAC.1